MSRRLSDFLAPFLDSRAPLLFIVASLALGMLGNALYSLLLLALGETPATMSGIIVAAALVLPLTYWSFRCVVEAIRRAPATKIQPDEEVEPHPGLVLLLSPNPTAADQDVVRHHQSALRCCWLIASREVEKAGRDKELQFRLHERNIYTTIVPIEDANQARATYAAIEQVIVEAQRLLGDAPKLIVDITGGTKPMTAGAVLACRDLGIPMEYAVKPRTPTGDVRSVAVPATPIKVRFEPGPSAASP